MQSKFVVAAALAAAMPLSAVFGQDAIQALKDGMATQSVITVAGPTPGGQNANDPLYSTLNGTTGAATFGAKNNVARLIITEPGIGTFGCTGTLINGGRTIVTAAHCIYGNGGLAANNVSATFFKADGTTETVSHITNLHYNPLYTGQVIDEHDIAVLNLDNPITDIQSADLYAGNGVGQTVNTVGYGLCGTGNFGTGTATVHTNGANGCGFGVERQGQNQFDFTGAEAWQQGLFGDQNVYLADFDNGTNADNAGCFLARALITTQAAQAPYCTAATQGLGVNEIDIASGDSGGPSFINGQIAAVTSFGVTFGGHNTCYLNGDPTGPVVCSTDVDGALNSSFGEMGGFTRVDINAGFIAAASPEPSSMALIGTGLFGLIPMVRRRNKKS